MRVLRALCLTFSMYSKIPVPKVRWDGDNMRYALCVLPVVGAVIGCASVLWFYVSAILGVGNTCFAAAAAALPVLITGGIHMDGFIDAGDALSSYGSREKKLEILSDPHVGAFGIISAVIYYILYLGFISEVRSMTSALITAFGYVMSRAACALTIACVKPAKDSGLLYKFSCAADRKAALTVNIIIAAVCSAAVIYLNPYIGAAVSAALALTALYCKFLAAKQFGGITGDTCGYLIQLCELVSAAVIAIGGRLIWFL